VQDVEAYQRKREQQQQGQSKGCARWWTLSLRCKGAEKEEQRGVEMDESVVEGDRWQADHRCDQEHDAVERRQSADAQEEQQREGSGEEVVSLGERRG